jgi:hypothetical protein
MKSMLIAASAVGAACAGLILYLRNKSNTNTSKGELNTSSPSMPQLETRSQHVMG